MLAGLAGSGGVAWAQNPPVPQADVPYPSQEQQQRPQQPQQQQQQWQQQQQQPQASRRQPSSQELRCMQLEQELANDWVHGQQGGDRLPEIEAEIRKYDRIYQNTQAEAERENCYRSLFIFGRSLVRTPKCLKLNEKIEEARRQLTMLEEERAAARNPGGQSRRQDELIDALARAGCGRQYQREARRRGGGGGGGGWLTSLFEDAPGPRPSRRDDVQTSKIVPFATYRTLCVRSCDGYYFPISYSALPSHFPQDVEQCRSQCAAPAELFVYRNPGEEPEQMVSADGEIAYNELPNAWRYRQEYVKGCSCKETEYDPDEIEIANQKSEGESQAEGGTAGLGVGQIIPESESSSSPSAPEGAPASQ